MIGPPKYPSDIHLRAKNQRKAIVFISIDRRYVHPDGASATVCGVVGPKTQRIILNLVRSFIQDKV